MTRVCVDTPMGRACYDDGRRRNNYRYPSNQYGFSGNQYYGGNAYGYGTDRGAITRQRRQEYWNNGGYGYQQDPYYNGYGQQRRDPRDLDGDGRVERWEMQQHRQMQQQQRYGYGQRPYYPEHIPSPRPYAYETQRPHYQAPYFQDPRSGGRDVEDLRTAVADNGVVTPRELELLLNNNNFNQQELGALLRDASQNQRLDDQRVLRQIFGREVRIEDGNGRDASAVAAQIVQRHVEGRSR